MRFGKNDFCSAAFAMVLITGIATVGQAAEDANTDASTTSGVHGQARKSPFKNSASGKTVSKKGSATSAPAGTGDSGMSAGYGNGAGMPTGNSGSSAAGKEKGSATSTGAGMNPSGPSHNSETPPH